MRRGRALLTLGAVLATAACGTMIRAGSGGTLRPQVVASADAAVGTGPVVDGPGPEAPPTSDGPTLGPVTGAVPAPRDVGVTGAAPSGRGTSAHPSRAARTTKAGKAPAAGGVVAAVDQDLPLGIVVPSADPASTFTGQASTSDYPGVAKALIADLNAHGGIAGRHVDLTVTQTASANDYSGAQAAQEVGCTSLTEDAHDLVVIGTDAAAAYATSCYVKHSTPLLVNRHVVGEADVAAGAPWIAPSTSASLVTIARSLPDALKQQGYISGRIATVTYDLPPNRDAVSRVLVPGLQAAGGNVVDQTYLPPSFTDAPSAIASAIVKFRQDQVDHVVFLSGLWPVFAVAAQSQAYFPRYGITSEELPKYSYTGFDVPAQQAHDLAGIGWIPALDLSGAGDAATPPSATEQSCWKRIAANGGPSYSSRGNGSYLNGLDLCELVSLLQTSLAPFKGKPIRAGDVLPAIRAAQAYQPTLIRWADTRSGVADYTAGYQWLGFGDDCSCLRYTSDRKDFRR